jgi:hypothetical protein
MTKSLSPAAQAVEDAYFNADGFGYRNGLAAALEAAADQVVPEENPYEGGFSDSLEHQYRASERRLARAELLAIAAELDNTSLPS